MDVAGNAVCAVVSRAVAILSLETLSSRRTHHIAITAAACMIPSINNITTNFSKKNVAVSVLVALPRKLTSPTAAISFHVSVGTTCANARATEATSPMCRAEEAHADTCLRLVVAGASS